MAHVYTMLFLDGGLMAHGEGNDYVLDAMGWPAFNFRLRGKESIVLHRFEDGLLKKIERYAPDPASDGGGCNPRVRRSPR